MRGTPYGRHELRRGTPAGGDERGRQPGELLFADVAAGEERQREHEHGRGQQQVAVDADERQRRQPQREPGKREEQLAVAARHGAAIVHDRAIRRNQARGAPPVAKTARLLYVPILMGGGSLKHGRTAAIAALAALIAVLGAMPPGVALQLAPALALFAVLLLGFTPGEQLLERMRARRFTGRAARAPRTIALRRIVVVRRMPSLAASALAMRPPPAVAPARIS
jgi:hypothetical protein